MRFPKLKLAFLEIGATWLPYYLDRLDEHWEKRAEVEMPLVKKKPSDIVRESKMYFSVEPGESQLVHTVDHVGADHFLYASDIPHWDNEFPRICMIYANTNSSRRKRRKRFSIRMPRNCFRCDVLVGVRRG